MSLPDEAEELGDPSILERMRTACGKLDCTPKKVRCVHVYGDVGKDSCIKMVSSILKSASYSAGHCSLSYEGDIRNCISINEKPISYAEFADIVTVIQKIYRHCFRTATPHRREIITLAAIYYFRYKDCDVSFFEKTYFKNDPVNVTEFPLMSIATPFTDRNITEKQFDGVIPKGTPETVSSPQHKEIYNAISDACALSSCRLTVPVYGEVEISSLSLFKTIFKYRGTEYSIRSFSPYQIINAITAIEVANAFNRIGATISTENVVRGIGSTALAGKCETVSINPTVILSSTHEKDRIDTFFASIAQIKDQLSKDIRVFIDADSEADVALISSYFESCEITPGCVRTISDSSSAKSGELNEIISTLKPESAFDSTVIFIGCRCFISTVKATISEHLGN
jgi:folylpolyglutamate synthase/dihydropteroate synthase